MNEDIENFQKKIKEYYAGIDKKAADAVLAYGLASTVMEVFEELESKYKDDHDSYYKVVGALIRLCKTIFRDLEINYVPGQTKFSFNTRHEFK